MDQWFHIKYEDNETQALLLKKEVEIPSGEVTFSSLLAWIESKGIRHGIRNEVLSLIAENLDTFIFPAEIAKGKQPKDGEPARLIPSISNEKVVTINENAKLDFKRLFTIPTAEFGEILARKVNATEGIAGISVFGKVLSAKNGNDLLVKNGMNTVFNESEQYVYASASGEVTFQKNRVNIYPVYRVDGDVSLKTGHIDFVGNVHITGDVPSGFKISAKGDVRIEGVVEAADITTDGNVVIGGGVLGQGKGTIRCGGDFTSLYISQGNVYANGNIMVAQTILHSHCEAELTVTCTSGKGNISGGTCIAGNGISAIDIGSETYSKTLLHIKTNAKMENDIVKYEQKILELQTNLEKLNHLKTVLIQKNSERQTINRIINTISQAKHEIVDLQKKIQRCKSSSNSSINIKGTLHPNVEICIGKYKRKIQSPFNAAKVFIEEKEIVVHSL
ncbi:DUF342 domain-containing protein [Fictibacillus sp. 23RED33]|uniref:DUF342 domain-containing protein n=1 Tax=Fictibacillus sp. 23RED33 TaxID=2745879 RepID=UPI0018CDF0F8|nr:FapA family protein [Fictibacillus sp. 23RED33]MBH0173101.1 DUF342 domain-containing protein [Fictibacillus sp. 23RED33]